MGGSLGEGALRIAMSGGRWERARPVPLGPARAALEISSALDVHVVWLEAGLARSRVRASGDLGRPGDFRPDLSFHADLDLAEAAALASLGPAAGRVTVDGRLTGRATAPRLEAVLAGEGLVASGWAVDRIAGRVAHEAGTTAASFSAALLGGASEGEARLEGSSARGRLGVSRLDLGRLPFLAGAGLRGAASGDLTFSGDLRRALEVRARLEADARVTGSRVFRAGVRAAGPVVLPGPRLDLAWTAAIETEGAASILPAGRLEAHGTATGSFPPALEGHLGGSLSLAPDGRVLPLTLRGSFRSRADRVNVDAALEGLGGPVTASMEIRGATVESLAMSGESVDLARLLPDGSGRGRFAFRASGPLTALSGSGTVGFDEVTWRRVAVGTVGAEIALRRGTADAALDLPDLHATARLQARPGPHPELRVDLARTPLAPVATLLPKAVSISGEISGRGEFAIPLEEPARTAARAGVESLELTVGDLSARSERPFFLRLHGSRLTVDGLRLEGPGFAVAAAGDLGAKPADPLALRVSVRGELDRLPLAEDWSLAGDVDGEVSLEGTRERPRVTGHVTLRELAVGSSLVPPLLVAESRLELQGDALVLPEVTARLAEGTVALSGRIPLSAALLAAGAHTEEPSGREEARLRAEWRGIDLHAILAHFRPERASSAVATLTGRADLRGRLTSLDQLRGSLALEATAVVIDDLALDVAPLRVELEAGRISTDGIMVRTPGGALSLAGSVDLTRRRVEASGRGLLELRALSPFLEEAALTGAAEVDLRAEGSLDSPRAHGTLIVSDGTLRLRRLPQAVTGIAANLVFAGTTVRLEKGSALLGGGEVTAAGGAKLRGATVSDVLVSLSGRDMALRYPGGLRSRIDAELTLTGGTGAFVLSGTVRAARGLYDLDVALEEGLRAPAATMAEPGVLRSVALDLDVETEKPVLVRSDLAELQAGGRLALKGDMENPTPFGALEILRGGKVFLQGREFVIETGHLIYQGTWDPSFGVEARSEARVKDQNDGTEYTVRAVLTGTLEAPSLHLSADPPLSDREILSLLATGRTTSDQPILGILGSHAGALLAGRVVRGMRHLGLDEVSIRPELVAREGEVETGARFTFGKRLTRRVNLIYSLNLQDPEARFVQAEVRPGRDVTLSAQRADDGNLTYAVGQRFRAGGPRRGPTPSDERIRIREVRIEGERPLPPEDLRRALRTRPGGKRSIWELQDDAERLRRRLVEKGYVEAEVGARLDADSAVFEIRSGARYRWRVDGFADPPDLSGEIRSSLFQEEALERGHARLLRELRRRGHLRASVAAHTVAEGDGRTLVFTARPGPLLSVAEVRFPGASALSPSRLLRAAGGVGPILVEPEEAVGRILAAYRERHHLAAEVDPPRIEGKERSVHILVSVREGPRARVARLRFDGATLPEEELARVAGLATGSDYDETEVAAAAERLRDRYLALGYPGIRVSPSHLPAGRDLQVVFRIAQGEQIKVGSVLIRGATRTREWLVRRQLSFQPGDPLDPRKLANVERRLLELGVFARAVVTVSPGTPADATVTVEEGEGGLGSYLLRYNDESEAVIVLNQELRYRHRSGVGGALFYDAGNVFARAGDMSLRWRHALGAGLRWESPVGLLRVDLGAPLRHQDDEKAYHLFLSLGQAF